MTAVELSEGEKRRRSSVPSQRSSAEQKAAPKPAARRRGSTARRVSSLLGLEFDELMAARAVKAAAEAAAAEATAAEAASGEAEATAAAEAAEPTPEISDEAQAKILKEVRIAAGRLGRLTLWGADMWIKDQYVDIFCRWVYLPLYAILAAISLNEST